MNYYINPSILSSVFTVPVTAVDNHLKFAKPDHFKVLLFVMRNMLNDVDTKEISLNTDLSEYDVEEALLYWADAGILCPKNNLPVNSFDSPKKKTIAKAQKPTRNDVAKRGDEDFKVKYLLREAQIKLGRNLKSNEASTLVWLYDDEGMDVSIILLIIQYAVAHNKANMRFIESTAVSWIDKGIDNIEDADEQLRIMALTEQAWNTVSGTFGLERRKPSKKEEELSFKWIEEWGFSKEMLLAAYEACVDAKSKFSIPYVAKILENWHSKGYKTPDDIERLKHPENESSGFAAYDLELFEKMINSKD